MTRMTRMYAFAAALTIIVAYIARHQFMNTGTQAFAAALVCTVAWRLFYRKPAPKKPTNNMPNPNSRAYARAMFFNGLISVEELQRFYDTHPEDEDGNSSARA